MERRNSLLLLLLLSLSFCQAAIVYSQVSACDPGDLAALQNFSRQVGSGAIDGWNFNESSSSSIDCCGWTGIICDDSSSSTPSDSSRRVVELDLSRREISGVLSDALVRLDRLRSLNLSNNSFSGTVPPELFRLQRLERLDLSVNDLSGVVPADSILPSVQVFNLSFNKFNGSHPVLPGSANLSVFDVGFNRFSGPINTSICSSSTKIKVLRFSFNQFQGSFPAGFVNCRSLAELFIDSNKLPGKLPDDLFQMASLSRLYLQDNRLSGDLSRLGNLSHLVELDISSNNFSGNLPDVFGGLKKLRYFVAATNWFEGQLPPSLSNLSTIQVLNMRKNLFSGEINLDFKAMPRLSFLDLGSNLFRGGIPQSIVLCQELKTLNLARNLLTGEIPKSFNSLRSLTYLSLSNNSLTNIASAFETLQQCPNLTNLVLTINFRGEGMPSAGIQGFHSLKLLVVANCGLSGPVPQWLSGCSKLQLLDLSWNKLEGTIPPFFGDLDFLFYLDLSNNSLTGPIPESLSRMKSLVSRDGSMPDSSTADFPFFSKTNRSAAGLQYNQVNSFKPSILLIWKLRNVHVLDLGRNNLSGIIPGELSSMEKLEVLDLSHNGLTGGIPPTLTNLSFLSSFSVAYNKLAGQIPLGGQFSTFQISSFVGNPGLCGVHDLPCPEQEHHRGNGRRNRRRSGVHSGPDVLDLREGSFQEGGRPGEEDEEATDAEDTSGLEGSKVVLLFQNRENKGLSINDVLQSTDNFDQANIIGCGGFGLVFKATLPDGTKVAIKRLSGDYGQMDREFQAEVEALSRAQHRNLVLLQGYCRIGKDRLLIYSYMENGSLDYWLHENPNGGAALDWPTRLRIAKGSARGCNILLDEGFEAHLADFGLARLVLPYDTHVTTDLVGTLGYIPPEYGQSSVATFKGDVYSFGVVLLELLTGRRPVDMCKPKGCRDLVSWVIQMRKEKREAEVFDHFIYDKKRERQLSRVLEIACLCLSESPKQRPLTQQIVPWLESIGLEDQAPSRTRDRLRRFSLSFLDELLVVLCHQHVHAVDSTLNFVLGGSFFPCAETLTARDRERERSGIPGNVGRTPAVGSWAARSGPIESL
ncbi:unnamed protein product [Spirodela intermedia]|uniref:Protein kinase domain-containing protein n=1 Tax=Spirodela intermedia TaxID=51605 RepID=A0A7I8IDQ4_SPIIN|nr:unnamed protein product [Spirodela intermedia]CAA6655789.1 unnamed protein product [Spirodela intermedia]